MSDRILEIIGSLYCESYETRSQLDGMRDEFQKVEGECHESRKNYDELTKLYDARLVDLHTANDIIGGLNTQIEDRNHRISDLEQQVVALQAKFDEFQAGVCAERSASLRDEFESGREEESEMEGLLDRLQKSEAELAQARSELETVQQDSANKLEDEKRKQGEQAKELAGARRKLAEVTKELEATKAASDPGAAEEAEAKLQKANNQLSRKVQSQKNSFGVAYRHLYKAVEALDEGDTDKTLAWIDKAMKLLRKESSTK